MYIGGNKLVDVPDSVGQLNQLQALNLSDNMLERLPAAIANLKNLKSLLLHKNRLRTLPTEIIALKCLTEVGIASALAGMFFFWHILIGSNLLHVQFIFGLSRMGSFVH